MKPKSNDELDLAVRQALQWSRGVDLAMDRWDLVRQIFGPGSDFPRDFNNRYDRAIRASVERLRHAGHLICDLGDGSGRFFASCKEEYLAFRAVYGSHAFPILENIHRMDKAAAAVWPDPLQPGLL